MAILLLQSQRRSGHYNGYQQASLQTLVVRKHQKPNDGKEEDGNRIQRQMQVRFASGKPLFSDMEYDHDLTDALHWNLRYFRREF